MNNFYDRLAMTKYILPRSTPVITHVAATLMAITLSACESFLAVDLPTTLVPQDQVFTDDITASSAIKGLYADLMDINGFSSGSNICAATLTGLSSDELHNYTSNIDYVGFEQNNIMVNNPSILNLWSSAYKAIYDANSALEGLQSATGLTPNTKKQLIGESLFIRAYCHFYLVNLFGAIPVITSTDYKINAKVSRTGVTDVYAQIATDLQQARELLSENYPEGSDRIRVNKSAATAMLARVSLYIRDWDTAASMATTLIENSTVYKLANDLNTVFLPSSSEAIWQLRMPDAILKNYTTYEGFFFNITNSIDLNNNVLSNQLLSAFDSTDLRKKKWIGRYVTSNKDTVYFPAKYKVKYGTDPAQENSTVLRLAEQYLIRAEALAMQGKTNPAINDVDLIRARANIPLIKNTNPGISQQDLLIAIWQERRLELFTEGAHRWFDLNRTGRADQTLALSKSGWSASDELYPIPQSELIKNKNLQLQNPGY